MPYIWVMPTLFYKYKNRKIYHVYRGAGDAAEFWFTTYPSEDDIDGECSFHFDVRDLKDLIRDPMVFHKTSSFHTEKEKKKYLMREAIKRNLIAFPED